MGAGEELVKNEAGAAEDTVNDATSATKNSKNDKGDSSESPAKDKSVDVEISANDQPNNAVEPVSNQTVGAENPANDKLNGAVNPENDQEGGVENLVSGQVNISETPVNSEAAGAEIPVRNQENVADNPVNDQPNGAVNPANDTEGVAENPINDQADIAETLGNNEASGAENPVSEQANIAENPVNDGAGIAESSASHQADVAETHANNQAGGAENPVGDQENAAENVVNDQAGGAENSENDLENVAEAPLNNQARGAENLLSGQVNSAENETIGDSTKDLVGGAENTFDKNEGGAEDPVNDIAGDEQSPENNKADDVEIPLNDKLDAAENLVEDREDAIGTPAIREADAVETSSNDEEDAVETPVSSKADRIPEEAKEILKSLAGKWEDVLDASALQVIPLKGAMTNQVFQIKWPTTKGETSRKVLVRIYGVGVDIFFNRDDEIRTFEYMSKNGQGPRLLGRFTNGRVEEFIHARTLSASDLRHPSISILIAAKMKEFHGLNMPGDKQVNLWNTLRIWLSEAKRLSSPKEVEAFYLDTIDKEISILEKEMSSAHQRIGFCHNDLQYGNIMLDEETSSVTIIDYEYASYNPVAYDIANHFCEMAANYHSEMPHILDYNKYPDFEERQRFLVAYLSFAVDVGELPSDSEVEHLLQEVEKYTLANHLFWGLWGIISGQVNTIDFDYKEYAKQRFQEYWARKPYLLSCDAPSPFNPPEATGEVTSVEHTKGGVRSAGILRKMKRVWGIRLFKGRS